MAGSASVTTKERRDNTMTNYELLIIILTVIGLLIATAKLFKR